MLLDVKSLLLIFSQSFNFPTDKIATSQSVTKKETRISGIEKNAAKYCLSRLYFALNRIQGALQIDKKKKKRETSVLECTKGPKNDMRRQKKLTERKHGNRKTEFERSVCRDQRGRSRESLFAPLWILLISLQFIRSRDTSFDASSRPTKRSL